jgi:RimJ/RimL family protein N-acetyltransferase
MPGADNSGLHRIDAAVVAGNDGAARFYARVGYRALGEERLAKVL